ncbi:hypothetical protein [Streptomyces sp. NPDC090022]|uniref:hypothetical protein n=1 Tax=Streptomyces sp. NPDC090022 TaxID=3365920 RepID=UPI0038025663
MTSTDERQARMYDITCVGAAAEPSTVAVAAGDVAAVIEQADRDGIRVLVRPYARRHGEQETVMTGKGDQQR